MKMASHIRNMGKINNERFRFFFFFLFLVHLILWSPPPPLALLAERLAEFAWKYVSSLIRRKIFSSHYLSRKSYDYFSSFFPPSFLLPLSPLLFLSTFFPIFFLCVWTDLWLMHVVPRKIIFITSILLRVTTPILLSFLFLLCYLERRASVLRK